MSSSDRYEQRGVSADKSEVHAAIEGMDKGLFPNAFCKVLPDVVGYDPGVCNLMHADTAGTKTSLAYLYWRETGDVSVWRGIAQDALVMNLDDMACVGCTSDIIISSTIGRNKHLIPGEIIAVLIQAAAELKAQLADYGVQLHLSGGETADVGDIVRTLDVGYTTFARMRRNQLIVNNIQPGDVIVGLASFGQAVYESTYNSGIGSNGLTSARHDVLDHFYAEKYPESYDAATPKELIYSGSRRLTEEVQIEGATYTVGQLLLSPTRTYLPVLGPFLRQHSHLVHGMIHCTGGGQTKVKNFIQNLRIIKDNLFDIPPLFVLIQQESGTSWQEMFQVFNMGHRLEVYLSEASAPILQSYAEKVGVASRIIGRVEAADQAGILIEHQGQVLSY